MPITRASLVGGPAYAAYNSANIHFANDSKIETERGTDPVESQMFGTVDEVDSDFTLKASGIPLTWDNLPVMFPYATPVFGAMYPLSADLPLVWKALNGDVYTLTNAVVTKMPDIYLGVSNPILGSMEWTGIIGDNMDPETDASYYTLSAGQTYTPLALERTKIPRKAYTASFSSVAGFTSFQAKEGWTITHELKLEADKYQGRTRAFKLTGYRAMAKCIPVGLTGAQIAAQLKVQGSGNSAGRRISAGANDLIIASSSPTVTLKNAVLKTAGFIFGTKPLRNGEIGFVTTNDPSSGTLGPVIVFS